MVKRGLLWLLKAYKNKISPGLPPACRFMPTCSVYTMESVERFGVIRGLILGGYRFLRCNPFGKTGIDPVPVRFGDAFFHFLRR